MAKRKFNKKYFDEEFYAGKSKGAIRNKNSPFYRFFAARVAANLIEEGAGKKFKPKDFSILDVGGGVGWEAKIYFETYGYNAVAADVSEWAYENSVMPRGRKICCDVRDLESTLKQLELKPFDLVIANRIMAYLPSNQSARKAIRNLVNCSKKHLLFAIICSDHKGVKVQEWAKGSGRINFQPKAVYEKMFDDYGLVVNEPYTNVMLSHGWDCIWWLEKE